MSKEKIYFRGFLTNTDSSILKIELDHGFKIEEVSEDEGIRFISNILNRSHTEVFEELFFDFPICNSGKCYFISNSLEYNIEMNDEYGRSRHIETAKFDEIQIRGYIAPLIRLMRLFKDGNIYMPLKFYYYIDNGIPKLFDSFFEGNDYSSRDIFTLKDFEISWV